MKTVIATALVLVMGATYAFSAPGRHGSALRPAMGAEERSLARIKRSVNDHDKNDTREHEVESHGHGSNETQVHDEDHEEGTHGHRNNEIHVKEITGDHDDHDHHHADRDNHHDDHNGHDDREDHDDHDNSHDQ
ncbi:urease accessory protein UreE-like [Penaeus chinensis]|uniref:urease accessory protein UreE-like n=1 Tax=Penaeus chinensis TaxID=139456 RepID=UPI001FB853AE|nr:urease accessory protein UreE-like [Penaeus chinensis]